MARDRGRDDLCELPRSESWLASLNRLDCPLSIDDRLLGTLVRRDGWSCAPRRLSRHWMILVLEGRCRGQLEHRPVDLKPGSLMWVYPGTLHDQSWSRTVRYLEMYLRLDDPEGRSLRPPGSGVVVHGALDLREPMEELVREVQRAELFSLTRLRALLTAFSILLWRCDKFPASSADRPPPTAGLTASQRETIVSYTGPRLLGGLPPSPADLADLIHLSPDYFSRQFRATFGESPRQWLTRQRIRVAAVLLENTGSTVYQVAERLGYQDVAQFSRQFLKITGVRPGRYAKQIDNHSITHP
ncbi:MAG: AraC family transcriptional regulator [Planctomycetota bacterium]